ncbi:MAG: primosomal protein N', partial [Oscillospiraceae bacterium]
MQGVFWIAKVAVNKAAYSFDKEYSYHIPSELVDKAVPGARVLVPFGKGNRTAIGFILRVFCQSEFDEKVKPLTDVIDDEPLVTQEMLKIIMWLKDSTFCTYYDAYRTVVPTGFSYSCSKSYTLANRAIDLDELSDNERDLLEQIQSCKSQKDINKLLDTGKNPELKPVVNSLIDKGILEDSNVLKRKVGDETVKVVRLSDEYT